LGSFGLEGLLGEWWHLNTPAAKEWVNVYYDEIPT
jgi:D-alanyl-D-alanine dipeptidase